MELFDNTREKNYEMLGRNIVTRKLFNHTLDKIVFTALCLNRCNTIIVIVNCFDKFHTW